MSAAEQPPPRLESIALPERALASRPFRRLLVLAQRALRVTPLPCTAEAFVARSPDVAAAPVVRTAPVTPPALALALAAHGLATVDIRADAVWLTGVLEARPCASALARANYVLLMRQCAAAWRAAAPVAADPGPARALAVPDAHTVSVPWALAHFTVSPRTAFLLIVEPRVIHLEAAAIAFVVSFLSPFIVHFSAPFVSVSFIHVFGCWGDAFTATEV